MKNNNETKSNVKSKFIIIMVICCLAGGIAGGLMGYLSENIDLSSVFQNADIYLAYIIPAISIVLFVIALCFCISNYSKAKKIYSSWDGENEESINIAELSLNKCITFNNINFILAFFLYGVGIYFDKYIDNKNINLLISSIIGIIFLANLVFAITMQRSAVELAKKISPEKKGDVLDFKFDKVWFSSLDEGEMLIQYKAAFKSYKYTTNACAALWLICLMGELFFNIGLAPMVFVSFIWLLSTIVYQVNVIKLENKR